jgi:DNA polymerase-4
VKRIILHIDVNNAFLSWTAVDRLNQGEKIDIRNRYTVIGGDEASRRGIVLAKSNLCKAKGVITGESLYLARKKCPYLDVYPANYKIYKHFSNKMYEYLLQYTNVIERYSIDECFLDYTYSIKLFGDPIKLAYKIKDDIQSKFGFTVNVGIGNNKLQAKMASDFSKPNKVHTLFDEEIKDKMWSLPIEDLFMLGKSSAVKLREIDIKTIGDLANTDVNFLIKRFKNHGKLMWEFANGIDNSDVSYQERDAKSISASTVLPYNYSNRNDCFKILKSLSMDVGRKLRDSGMYAGNINIWIKYSNFIKVSKQMILENRIHTDEDIYKYSTLLFDKLWDKDNYIRGLCVGVGDLSNGHDRQLSLFDINNMSKSNAIDKNKDEKVDKLQKILDEIRNKYGKDKIMYADMIRNKDKS